MATAEVNNDCALDPQSEAATSVHGTSSRIRISKINDFKSNEHPVNSLKVMETYFHDQRLTDVTLVAGTKRIPAHRLVLCAASDYFAAMFTSPLRESVQSEVELKEVDGEILLALVEYCYTGCIELREENLETLFQSARLLQLNLVVEACCQFLIRELDPGNCLGIKMFADALGCSDLSEGAHRYALEHFVEVINNQEYLTLPRREVAKLLESDDLNVPSEETVFHALTSWIKHDSGNRSRDASELLSCIRLPLLSPAFLFANIENNELFGSQATVHALMIEALKYHLLPDCKELLQSDRVKPRKNNVPILLAVGGIHQSRDTLSIEAFSLHVNAWQDLTSMRNRSAFFGAAVLDEKLVVGGGIIGEESTDVVECYDFSNKMWDTLSPMQTPRHALGFAVLRGSLYAVGGSNSLTKTSLEIVERWDQTADRWNYVAPLRTARSGMGVAVYDNKLYAVGGMHRNAFEKNGLNTMERYDPFTNEWTFCTPMSKQRRRVSIGVLNEYLYVLGGYEKPDCLDSVERYDPKTDTWTMVARMSVARCNVGACALGGRLFAVGGIDANKKLLTMVEKYDPDRDEWQKIAPLEVGRAGPCVVFNGSNFRT